MGKIGVKFLEKIPDLFSKIVYAFSAFSTRCNIFIDYYKYSVPSALKINSLKPKLVKKYELDAVQDNRGGRSKKGSYWKDEYERNWRNVTN